MILLSDEKFKIETWKDCILFSVRIISQDRKKFLSKKLSRLTAYFHKLSALLRVHPSLWLVSRRRITSYGCSAEWFCLYAFRTFWQSSNVFTYLSIFNQYRFSSSFKRTYRKITADNHSDLQLTPRKNIR